MRTIFRRVLPIRIGTRGRMAAACRLMSALMNAGWTAGRLVGWLAVALTAGRLAAAETPAKVPALPVVVVIDSGLARGHPAFRGWLLETTAVAGSLPPPLQPGTAATWAGWDFVDQDAEPQDRTGHGTHVAGLVAAALTQDEKPLARLVMFRTGDQRHELAAVAGALEAVAALRRAGWDIPVVLGAFDYRRSAVDGPGFERFDRAFRDLLNAGVTCVVAAGNGDGNIDSEPPASAHFQTLYAHPALLVVAACSDDGQLLAASNYGSKSVTLAAPGLAASSAARDGGTTALSGSSQAAARVAGRLARHAVETADRKPEALRAWLLGQLKLHPSLVGRVASGGFLPNPAP